MNLRPNFGRTSTLVRGFGSNTFRLAVQVALLAPLLTVGIVGLVNPLLIVAAGLLAAMPWLDRWLMIRRLTRPAVIGGPLLLWSFSATISLGAAYDLFLSLPAVLTLIGSQALFFALINTQTPPRSVGMSLVTVAALAAIYFIGQYGHFNYQAESGLIPELGRLTGSLLPNFVFFTPHPNAVAGFLVSVVFLSLLLVRQSSGSKRWIWSLAALVIGYGLLISESRGAWLALGVTVGGAALWRYSRRLSGPLVVVLAALSVIIGAVLIDQLMVPYPHLPMIRGTVEVVSSRFSLYRNSLNLFNDYLFTGIGLGDTFAMVYSHYQLMFHVPFLFYAHNLFLAVALGQGILGLVALIWLVFSFFGFVYQVEQSSLNDEALSIFRAAWLGVTITFIHGLTDAPQFSPDRWTMVMLFALLGLTVAAGKSVLRQEETESRTSSELSLRHAIPWKWAGLAVFGFTMIFLIFGNGLLSIFYANIGSVYQSRADLSSQLDNVAREAALAQSIVYFERALKFNPSQPVANRRLGLIALEQQRYDMAVGHLEQAHLREPHNQATLKSLGYGYLWSGNLPAAMAMFRQVEMRDFLRQELVYWQWQWREQGREDLAGYAQAMLQTLSEKSQ